jgi:hypothetical protein
MKAVAEKPSDQAKRNLRLAWLHVAIALGFLGAFVWHLSTR